MAEDEAKRLAIELQLAENDLSSLKGKHSFTTRALEIETRESDRLRKAYNELHARRDAPEQHQLDALQDIAHQLKRIADHVCGATTTQFGSTIIKGPVP